MAHVTTSPARDQALRDSLLVRYAAAAAAGNIELKRALNQEAVYLGIQLNNIVGLTPGSH
ncbi:hypothetical protein AAF143_07280 [Cyanobium sp. ATX-6F1]|nr:hypothetical protein [Cyanobium sp. ATX 6F1]